MKVDIAALRGAGIVRIKYWHEAGDDAEDSRRFLAQVRGVVEMLPEVDGVTEEMETEGGGIIRAGILIHEDSVFLLAAAAYMREFVSHLRPVAKSQPDPELKAKAIQSGRLGRAKF